MREIYTVFFYIVRPLKIINNYFVKFINTKHKMPFELINKIFVFVAKFETYQFLQKL